MCVTVPDSRVSDLHLTSRTMNGGELSNGLRNFTAHMNPQGVIRFSRFRLGKDSNFRTKRSRRKELHTKHEGFPVQQLPWFLCESL